MYDSHDALGLVAALKPNESGGNGHNQHGRSKEETIPSTCGDPKGVTQLSSGGKTPGGYGRILRDEQGNPVEIEFEDVGTMDTDENVETMDAYVDDHLDTVGRPYDDAY